ncbi:MAG: adenylate/guanylate cyclase domain-containing protein [Desulfobulbaceae bacterium]|nr:adenylate/guanylate cyclase domain-containing protein [Desulfobulbaceae bacterium]
MIKAALLKPSPFKIGCLVVFAALCLFHSFENKKPVLLASFDNRITDALFHLRGIKPTSGSVVLVDIDDASLARVGQWPWPRNIVADLAAQIHQAGARSIGFDILFAEPDRTSPKNHLNGILQLIDYSLDPLEREKLQQNPALDNDLILGNTLSQIPSVLSYAFLTSRNSMETAYPFPSCTIHIDPPSAALSDINFIPATKAVVNINEVAQSESEGFFNVFPDASGTVRKIPLFMSLSNVPYPSLALEILRIGKGEQDITIHVSRHVQTPKKIILGITIGDSFIPTDDQGQISVNYRGPVKTFPYIPAANILEKKQLENLKDKYVIIGTSAAGLLDLRATPFSNIFPGMEIQANAMDNMLKGDPLIYDLYTEIALTYILTAATGILLSALLAFATPLAGALGGLLCMLATLSSSYFFFITNNKIVGITFPMLTIVIVFLVVTIANYFFAGREKRFIKDAFTRYVSSDVVDEIIQDPSTLSLSGQVRDLTVFFSDIRDFTTLSENMTPEQLGRFMNLYLTAMSDILMKHNGTVDKYIGDAIMAIWGAPLRDNDHAAKAVRAALASIKRLQSLQNELDRKNMPKIAIGIGLNSGDMNVGNFGSTLRFDYTVLGDNVNLASRLEGLTKVYGCRILISESTRNAIAERFFCCPIDRVQVKGKELPVDIFEPLCEGEPDPSLREEVTVFEKALEAYRSQDFKEAHSILVSLAEKNPKKLYTLYLERTEQLMNTPPSADWNGVFVFTQK